MWRDGREGDNSARRAREIENVRESVSNTTKGGLGVFGEKEVLK